MLDIIVERSVPVNPDADRRLARPRGKVFAANADGQLMLLNDLPI